MTAAPRAATPERVPRNRHPIALPDRCARARLRRDRGAESGRNCALHRSRSPRRRVSRAHRRPALRTRLPPRRGLAAARPRRFAGARGARAAVALARRQAPAPALARLPAPRVLRTIRSSRDGSQMQCAAPAVNCNWLGNNVTSGGTGATPMNTKLSLPTLALSLTVLACGDGSSGSDAATITVVTTVSPIRNIIENVGGDRVTVSGLVPEGTNSHAFEPPPSAARDIAEADLIVINGLNLELPALELAEIEQRQGRRDRTPRRSDHRHGRVRLRLLLPRRRGRPQSPPLDRPHPRRRLRRPRT